MKIRVFTNDTVTALYCCDCKSFTVDLDKEPCKSCYNHCNWEPRKPKGVKMEYPKLDLFDIVELRDGRLAVVLLVSEDPDEKTLALYSRSHEPATISELIKVYKYDDQLYVTGYDSEIADDYAIMKVLKYSKVRAQLQFSYNAYMRLITDILIRRGLCWDDFKGFNMEERIAPYDWTWVREECKEVTMAEVEEKFGCKVKIVKE